MADGEFCGAAYHATGCNHQFSKTSQLLVSTCCVHAGADKYFDDKDAGGVAGAEGEMYPYVSFSISIDS